MKHEMFKVKQPRTSIKEFISQRTSFIKRQEEATYFEWAILKWQRKSNKRSKKIN